MLVEEKMMHNNHLHYSNYLLIATIVLAGYGNSLNNSFSFDDRALILEDQRIINADWEAIFTQSYWGDTGDGLYRPLTSASLALNWLVGRDSPFSYHLVNMVLHILVAAMLCYIGLRGQNSRAGLVGAIFFALHPGPSEAVFSIVGRAELLACFWGMLAIICSLYSRDGLHSGKAWLPAIFLSLVAAMLCKENGTVFAVGIVVCGICREQRLDHAGRVALLAIVVAFACKLWAIGVLRPESIGYLDNPLAYLPADLRIAHGFSLVGRALLKMAFPWPLAADYSSQQIPIFPELTMPELWLPALWVISMGIVSILLVARNWDYFIWMVLCAGGILLVSNIFIVTGTIFAERLLYIPTLGLAAAGGMGLSRLKTKLRIYLSTSWILIAVSILAGRGLEWRGDMALFTSAVEVHPQSARSHFGLGLALHREGNLELAIGAYKRALEMYPRYFEARLNLGAALLGSGKLKEAITIYRQITDQRPRHFQGRYVLALLEQNNGNREDAEKMLRQLHEERPDRLDIIRDFSNLLIQKNDLKEAESVLVKGLQVDPDNKDLRHLQMLIK